MSQSGCLALDKGSNIDTVNDNIIEFHGGSGHGELLRAAEPISTSCTYYYFEIKIISREATDGVNMGFSSDYEKSEKKGQANNYKPILTPKQLYNVGDIIGCYVDFMSSSYFFTMNGKILCAPISSNLKKGTVYPTVSLSLKGDIVSVNFKEETCQFNVQGKNM